MVIENINYLYIICILLFIQVLLAYLYSPSPGFSPGFGLSHVASPAQAQFKPGGGLGRAGLKWAGLGQALGFGPGPAHH